MAQGREEIKINAGARLQMKAAFIRHLAKYLAGNQAMRSASFEVEVKAGKVPIPWAQEWADLRGMSPIRGYVSVEEAEALLWDLLG